MKQMVMFEPADLALLRRGESLTLRVGDQEVTIGYAGPRAIAANGGRPAAPSPEGALVCPTCGRGGFKARINMLEHHRRVHGRPSPMSQRVQAAARRSANSPPVKHNVTVRDKYKAAVTHAYGQDRCSACKQPKTDLRLFPATREGWIAHRKESPSSWTVYHRVAAMIEKDGMMATKKLWHYGCRPCMHRGANAARREEA